MVTKMRAAILPGNSTDGKKKRIVEQEGSQIWAWDYLQVGDRFKYHPQFEPHPVKRTMKNYKIFSAGSYGCRPLFYAARYRSCFSIGVRTPRLRCTRRVL